MLIASAAWTVMVRVPDLTLKGHKLAAHVEPLADEVAKKHGVTAYMRDFSGMKQTIQRIRKNGKPTEWVRFSQLYVVEAFEEIVK